MKDYDATEVAFNNGKAKGDAEGYERGFGDGLAAAGIAPVQWRDVRDVPFKPDEDTDYLLILAEFRRQAFRWKDPILQIIGREKFRVLFWCPIQMPLELAERKAEDDD